LRREIARLLTQFAGLGQHVGDLEVPERHHPRAVGTRHRRPLLAQAIRHHHEHPVTLDGGHHRHRVASITAGRFNDRVARPQQPFGLGPLDQILRYPRLDRA
jgi:hypothetical protein